MKQKSVGLTLRALIFALVLSLVAGTPALPPLDGVAYAQSSGSGLTATLAPDNSSVNLNWTAVSGADSYEIWRGEVVNNNAQWGTSFYDTVTGEDTTTYTDDDVTAGTTYAYAVRSVTDGTAAGWTGPYPNVAIPGGTQAPTAAPTVSVAPDGLTAVDVSWTTVTGATGYYVQFWHAGLDDWERISGSQTSPYKHENLTPGTEYYYVVAAFNAGGMGPWSSWRTDDSKITLQGTTTVPVVTLTRVDRTTVDISWTPTGAGAQYDLQRRRVVLATATADGTVTERPSTETSGSDASFTRLPSSLLTDTSYRDSAANFVAPADDATSTFSVEYRYRVQAQDSNGITGDWSAVKSVTIPRAGAVLPAPSISVATLSDSNIRVSWANVAGAEFYELQWKSGDRSYSTPIRVNRPDSGNALYDHTNLSPSTKYTYQVRGVDINGPGDWSSAGSTTTRSAQAAAGQMPKVTGLTVTDATSDDDEAPRTAKLTWNAVSGATHYQIQFFDPTADTPAWTNVAETGLTDGRITVADAKSPPTLDDVIDSGANGKTYFYVVSAIDDRGDAADLSDDLGEWSDYKSVTFKDFKPLVPTGPTTAKTSGTSILVSWTAPDDSGATDGTATSYRLEWRTSATTTFVGHMDLTGTSYHHTGLSGNTSYHYRVRAQNSGGESDWLTFDAVVLGNTLTPPTGLRAVDATTGNPAVPGIKISWNAVRGADSYEIQRFGTGASDDMWGDLADDAGTPPGSGVTGVSGTSITNNEFTSGTNLGANTTYLYRVRTVKEGATSGWSATVSGTTDMSVEDAPTLVATSTGSSMIRLSWSAVSGATTFEIEFLEGVYTAAQFDDPNIGKSRLTVSGNFRNYVHTSRKAGTRYSYRLRAALPQGAETAWSAVVSQYTRPAAPDLRASATVSTTMVLTWDAVSFVTDATPTAAGRLTTADNYQIERREAGSSDWVNVATTGLACPNNKCTLDDTNGGTNLDASTHYYYRIRATVTRNTIVYTSYWDYTNQRTPK